MRDVIRASPGMLALAINQGTAVWLVALYPRSDSGLPAAEDQFNDLFVARRQNQLTLLEHWINERFDSHSTL